MAVSKKNSIFAVDYMNVPTKISQAAHKLIEIYGNKLAYLGEFESSAVYQFKFPNGVDVGFPILYLMKDNKVKEVSDFEALAIITSLVKD